MGAVLGSFIATLVIRWPASETALQGRSRCDGCGATLPPDALVPVLSYVVQRGRARCCGQLIDRIHPAAELCAAAIGGVSCLLFGWEGWGSALLGWLLLALALFDLRHFVLPDWLNGVLAVSGLAVAIWVPLPPIGDRLIGLATGYAVLALIGWGYHRLRRREGLGGGDPKLLGAIGAWIGWQALPVVMLAAAALGIAVALVMRASGRPVTATTRMPLGTLMAAVAWPLWLWMQAGPVFPAR